MTELERRAALSGIIAAGPNASYDSAIDSLPDECYYDLANQPSVSLRRSSLFGVSSQAMATGKTTLSASPLMACSTTATAPSSSSSSYQCKSSPQASKSASLNGPIMFNPSQQSATNGALSVYRSLADYHRLNGNSTTSRFSVEQMPTSKGSGPGLSLASIRVRQGATTGSKVLDSRTSMAMFLDQIDASSSSLLHGKGQASQQRLTDSCARRQSTSPASGNSSRRGATVCASTWCSQLRAEQQAAGLSGASSGDMVMLEEGKQHGAAHVLARSGECLRQLSQQRVCSGHSPTGDTAAAAALSASSLLRSSRSFSTSYRQRPNVTRKCFCVPTIYYSALSALCSGQKWPMPPRLLTPMVA